LEDQEMEEVEITKWITIWQAEQKEAFGKLLSNSGKV
jgi:hypothetical protein